MIAAALFFFSYNSILQSCISKENFHNASNGTTQTGSGTLNITLTATQGCSVSAPQTSSIVPSTGGTVSTSSIAINIPPNALGTGSSNVSFSVAKPDSTHPATLNAAPITNSMRTISASDSNGTAITSLSNSIEIKITYSDSDIPAGTSASNLQLAYWDTTTNTWNPVSATIDTILKTITAKVNHLTDFAPIYPVGDSAPSTPTGLTAAKNGASQIDLSWTAVSGATSYLLYRDTSSGGTFPYLTTVTTTSSSDTGLSAGTTYYYKVTASNANGESAASGAASATTPAAIVDSGSGVIIGFSGGGGGIALAPAPTPAKSSTTPSLQVASPVVQQIPVVTVSPVFKKNLFVGSRGNDVTRLQTLLGQDATVYPEKLLTGYFGSKTVAAVKRFQKKYGITPVNGRVGPKTRAKLNEIFGGQESAAPSSSSGNDAAVIALQAQLKALQDQLQSMQAKPAGK